MAPCHSIPSYTDKARANKGGGEGEREGERGQERGRKGGREREKGGERERDREMEGERAFEPSSYGSGGPHETGALLPKICSQSS